MLEAVEAVADGLSEVAALMCPHHCDISGDLVMTRPLASDESMSQGSEGTFVGERHEIKFLLCVRSTFEFDIVCDVFNGLEEFVPL